MNIVSKNNMVDKVERLTNKLKNLLIICILSSLTSLVQAKEQVTSIVEFFSFSCSHCANVSSKLNQYVVKHHINFLDINVDNSAEALPINIMYYLAIDAGVGTEFKQSYSHAVFNGMAANSQDTLTFVTKQVQNAKLSRLMQSSEEKQIIKQKLVYVQQLLQTYNVRVTPSFLINQTTLVEGEDVVNNLIEADNEQ